MSVGRFLQKAAAGAATGDESDENFKNVVLLLDGDGTSGDANNTFTDSSTNGYTITESGTVIQGSFNPYSDRWSVYYDGSSSTYYPGGTQYEANTTGFTVSFFAKGTATGTNVFVAKGTTSNIASSSWWVETVSGVMKFYISNGSSYVIVSDTVSFSSYNGWVHVAAVIDNGTAKLYMNGELKSSQSVTAVNPTGVVPVSIGAYYNGNTYGFTGYISNVRIHQSALYSGSSFDVPTTMKREDATLWSHYGRNRQSTFQNHGMPTYGANIKFVPYSPVTKEAITQELNISDGGSGYFDLVNSSYLKFSGGPSSVSDITISGWIYPKTMAPQSGNAYPRIFAAGAFLIYVRDDDIRIYNGGEKVQAPINNNEWTYFAAQRSNNTWTLYIDGASKGTASDSTNISLNSTNFIGAQENINNVGQGLFTGYICDLRITTDGSTSVGTPTSPVSAVTNTELLLNFQDAGIYDRTGINNIEAAATAQLDTAVTKYGTGSIEFDGSTAYLLGSENPSDILALNDAFTAECWFYQTATAGTGTALHALIGQWNNATGNKAFVMGISNTSMILYVSNDGSTNNISGATGGTVSNNTWNHAALTWDGTNYRVFLNGTAVITQANSSAPYSSNEVIQIGAAKAGSGGGITMKYQGFMDDVRITNGVARYTSSFTPPTKALPKF